jgi:hypothetical protein
LCGNGAGPGAVRRLPDGRLVRALHDTLEPAAFHLGQVPGQHEQRQLGRRHRRIGQLRRGKSAAFPGERVPLAVQHADQRRALIGGGRRLGAVVDVHGAIMRDTGRAPGQRLGAAASVAP